MPRANQQLERIDAQISGRLPSWKPIIAQALGPQPGSVRYRLKSITPADGGDLQMKARMPGVTTVIDEIFRRFLRGSNLRQNSVGRMVFSEMGAKAALAFLHL